MEAVATQLKGEGGAGRKWESKLIEIFENVKNFAHIDGSLAPHLNMLDGVARAPINTAGEILVHISA